jgi:hypothetical protein
MTWVIVFFFIVTAIFFIEFINWLMNLYGDSHNGFNAVVYGVLFIVSLTTAIVCVNTPKAIDVYRGKTSLKITSINNIPTDTIVVWKN